MTSLIVEDGSEVANANSYVSLADADAYFALSNNTTWDNLDQTDQKIPALISATRYMQQAFRRRWQGYRHTNTQKLDWPRLWVQQIDAPGGYGPYPFYYAPTVIPQEIKDAQCELALRASAGDLAPDIDRVERMVKVGSIQVEYDPNYSPITVFRAVELLLAPFFMSADSNVKIGRM